MNAKKSNKDTSKKPIAAVYARKSREDARSDSVSIDEQITNGIKLAESLGYRVPKNHIYQDVNLSGKLPPVQFKDSKRGKHRQGLTDLLDAIHRQEVSLVIVRKTDRLARNTILSLRIYEFLKDHKTGLQATSETLPTDGTGDASSTFALTVLMAAAQLQLEQITENIQKAKTYCKDNGLAMTGGERLLGYCKDVNGKIIIDPIQGNIVKNMFKKYLYDEMSLVGIAKYFNTNHPELRTRNSKPLQYTTVKERLINPAYIGMAYDSKGHLIPSQVYPKLISLDIWQRVQTRLKQRKNTKSTSNFISHLMSGFITCSKCGGHLTPYISYDDQKNKGGKYHYYKCRHCKGLPCIREDLWETLAKYALAPISLNIGSIDNEELITLSSKLDKIDANIKELKGSFAKGEIDLSTYKDLTKALESEKSKTALKIDEINTVTIPHDKIEWDKATTEQKRDHIYNVLDKMIIGEDGVLIIPKPNVKLEVANDLIELHENKLFYPVIKYYTGTKCGKGFGRDTYRLSLMLPNGFTHMRHYNIDGESYGIGEGQIKVYGPAWETNLYKEEKFKDPLYKVNKKDPFLVSVMAKLNKI